jgi:probable phosphoglycerate mutase
MTRIWLVRHGEAHVNHARDDGMVHLVDEYGLTDKGIEQAKRLGDRLAIDADITPDVVVASTFPRAHQTAVIAAASFGKPIVANDSVQEWRLGSDAVDLTYDEALASWARICAGQGHDDRLSPETETHNEFVERVDTALLRIAETYHGKQVLVFTHGGVVGRSFVTFMGLPGSAALVSVRPRHTSLTEWALVEEFGAPRWMLARYNDVTHLG